MRARGLEIKSRVGRGDVAHQNRCAASGLAHRGRTAADTGKVHQRRVDLAEFNAAATDFHLIVGAALEVQTLGFQPYQIARTVGATPAQRRHRRVLLGVLVRIQVTRQSDAADHQFAHSAEFHRGAGVVDDGQVPAGQGQPDADRADAVEPGPARHHGGLRRPVGVPHLAAVHRKALRQFRRAGFSAEDQQPHRFQGLSRPQGRKSGHRRDHGDIPRYQPGSQVHTAAHQGARCRHQAGAMSPGQPNLLAGGVESD